MMSYINYSLYRLGFLTGVIILLNGCATVHSTQLAYRCNIELSNANHQLQQAKADGYGRSLLWTKAASLLTSAKIQQQFEKYPTCINKSARALYYISRSKHI